MNSKDTTPFSSSGITGTAVLRHIGLRETANAQARFLRLLQETPYHDKLVLKGSAAIQGVYLQRKHQRFIGDLDFIAEPQVVEAFHRSPEIMGLPVKKISDKDGKLISCFIDAGAFYKRVVIPVDVSYCQTLTFSQERSVFHSLNGEQIFITVQARGEVLGGKLNAIATRIKATDYLDLWHWQKENLDTIDTARRFLGTEHLPQSYDATGALHRLEELSGSWCKDLTESSLISIPEHRQVHQDLSWWLNRVFSQNERTK